MSLRDKFRPVVSAPPRDAVEAAAAQELSKRRGRSSRPPAPPAGKVVTALVRPLANSTRGLGLGELKRRWAEIAGETFARAEPEKLSGGILTLRAPGALAPFLQQQAPLLIERLRLAGAAATSVRIEQRRAASAPAGGNVRNLRRPLAPEEETALKQSLDRVADAGLKSALLRLGRAVRQG